MPDLTTKKIFKIFTGYFLGYSLLIFPLLIFVFDGRAIGAELAFAWRNIVEKREVAFNFNVAPKLEFEMPQIAIPLPELNAPDVKIPEVKVKTPAIAFQNPFRFLSQIDIPFLKEKKKPATSDIFSINKPAFANETNLVALQNFDPGPKNPFPESEASILIPKIDISAPIILSQSPRNRDMLKDLEKGTALYPESPLFGEQGVSIILGHSSAYPWYRGNYGSVFALLNKLELGDEFYVFFKGNRYTYQVANKKVVVPEDFKVENPDHGSHLILMSCWPVGTNWKRIVVFSDLINFN